MKIKLTLLTLQLPYILSVNYDNQGVMLPPQMNISTTGVIPTSVQTFRFESQYTVSFQFYMRLNPLLQSKALVYRPEERRGASTITTQC